MVERGKPGAQIGLSAFAKCGQILVQAAFQCGDVSGHPGLPLWAFWRLQEIIAIVFMNCYGKVVPGHCPGRRKANDHDKRATPGGKEAGVEIGRLSGWPEGARSSNGRDRNEVQC
ncbi:hypothetical protein KU6B_37870 [Mameliella alba]|nr:hypothetical protein KU6B_37870 [Mameliella alba]